jgi:hypothetical protein
MADFDGSFLEEQLERMRRLNERLSQLHDRVVENSEHIARDRDRLHSAHDNARRHQTDEYPQPAKRKRKR